MKAKKKKTFNFSKAIDRVSVTLTVPQVTDSGTVETVEVVHNFKIDSLFDAMEAYRSELYVINKQGPPSIDTAAAGLALWDKTIVEVDGYDLDDQEDWKKFFHTNPIALEHASQAGTLLAERLGMMQGKLAVPFGK